MSDCHVEPSVITQEFSVPRQLVFDAWTKVEHLSQWMFPMSGCTCEFFSVDIVAQGSSLHKVTMPNGYEMWLFTQYEEVNSPEKIVFLQYMSNASGAMLTHSNMPDWPKDMVATLLFEAESERKTKLTFLWEPRNPTLKERDVFEATRLEHVRGWNAGIEQLQRYLEQF